MVALLRRYSAVQMFKGLEFKDSMLSLLVVPISIYLNIYLAFATHALH
tara:strand:+ start:742 stop:885 length:144 start_codon:yes stop_codon:yes gene_type:complete